MAVLGQTWFHLEFTTIQSTVYTYEGGDDDGDYLIRM